VILAQPARAGRADRGDWLGPGLALAGLLGALALLAPLLLPPSGDVVLTQRFAAPFSPGRLLGADQLGRDLSARIAAGASWSLGVAFSATALAAAIGVPIGLAAAQARGWLKALALQAINLALAFPALVAALCLLALIGQGFFTVLIVLGVLTAPVFARVAYAEASSLLARDYVLAARLAGVGPTVTLARHVLPGMIPSLAALGAFHFADMLIAESALAFLGVGAPLDAPSWGAILAESRSFLVQAPWIMLAPAAAMVLAVLAATLIGEGLAARAGRGR
jgi:peptide/nickel transport system permease protein